MYKGLGRHLSGKPILFFQWLKRHLSCNFNKTIEPFPGEIQCREMMQCETNAHPQFFIIVTHDIAMGQAVRLEQMTGQG